MILDLPFGCPLFSLPSSEQGSKGGQRVQLSHWGGWSHTDHWGPGQNWYSYYLDLKGAWSCWAWSYCVSCVDTGRGTSGWCDRTGSHRGTGCDGHLDPIQDYKTYQEKVSIKGLILHMGGGWRDWRMEGKMGGGIYRWREGWVVALIEGSVVPNNLAPLLLYFICGVHQRSSGDSFRAANWPCAWTSNT